MKLHNLARQTTAPSNCVKVAISLVPDLWEILVEYRKRREQSGLVRLGLRVVLGLIGDDDTLESAADHLAVSCQSDEDLSNLARRCGDLSEALRSRLE